MSDVPEGWNKKKLGNLGTLIMGQSPKGSSYNKKESGIPLLNGAADLSEKGIIINQFTSSPTRLCKEGDLVFCIRATIGNIQFADRNYCLGRGVAAFRPNENIIHKALVFHCLNFVFDRMRNLSQGGVIKGLRKDELQKFEIIFPEKIDEQQKIAEILTTVDDAIEATDKIIKESERVKKGLMRSVLIKGIPNKHSEYKNTPIGKIPVGWDIKAASKVCDRVTDGTHNTPKPKDTGYRLVTSKNLKNGDLDFNNIYHISKEDYDEINKRSKVDVGDILFGMIGTIGNPIIIQKRHEDFAIKNVGLLKISDMLLSKWIHYYLYSTPFLKYMHRLMDGSSQKFVPLGFLRKMLISIPPEEEMINIVEMLEAIDEKLKVEYKKNKQLQRTKKGLMQKLLTGQIRVKVD